MTDKREGSKDYFVIAGTAFWSHHGKVNELSGKYQMDLSVDAETKKILESKGVHVSNKPEDRNSDNDKGDYVTLKSTFAPKIVDAKKNPMSSDIKIGNGSKVKVLTHIYDWTFKKKSGKSLGFDSIQVIALVEYGSSTTDAFEEEEGYTTTITSSDELQSEPAFGDDVSPFD